MHPLGGKIVSRVSMDSYSLPVDRSVCTPVFPYDDCGPEPEFTPGPLPSSRQEEYAVVIGGSAVRFRWFEYRNSNHGLLQQCDITRNALLITQAGSLLSAGAESAQPPRGNGTARSRPEETI